MMRPLLISTSDLGHGAGIAAYRLHQGLNAAGVESRMLVSDKLSDDPAVVQVPPPPRSMAGRAVRRLLRMCEYALNQAGPQNLFSLAAPWTLRHPWTDSAGVIHLHNIHWHSRNFSPLMLPYLSRKKPLVWTIHDMWPLTGHCYNPIDCERWLEGCGRCPDLKSYIRLSVDTTAAMVRLKRSMVEKSRMVIVTPSRWMKGQVEESSIFYGKDVRCISNGVDTRVFRPLDRAVARDGLGIPQASTVILFVASRLHDPMKGYMYFLETLARLNLPKNNALVLTMGSGSLPLDSLAGFPMKSVGYVADESRMAKVYAAADVLVMPSLQDNLPNVVLECLACGTPVVCFDAGGLKDMVRHGENGYVARHKNTDDLAAGIEFVLAYPDGGRQLRHEAVKTVRDGFTLERMVQAHLSLYAELSGQMGEA